MKPQMSPLFTINRAYYAIEAFNLAERAGRGATAWSRIDHEAPLNTGRGRSSIGIRNPRRALTAVAALVMIGGFAVAGWMA